MQRPLLDEVGPGFVANPHVDNQIELVAGLHVTVSVGVAHWVGWPTAVERLVGEADVLLYTAKQAGRNAVAFRDTETGFVRLAGAAGARRAIPQLPVHERAVRRPAVG